MTAETHQMGWYEAKRDRGSGGASMVRNKVENKPGRVDLFIFFFYEGGS